MVAVTSWGRLSSADHLVASLRSRFDAGEVIKATKPGIAYGMGRSYGDACLNPGGVLWETRGLDRFIRIDIERGRLVCEAGVLLRDIQEMTIARGWILPVTPGTQLVTVGGAIANDIHGKNHHSRGSFGDHILGLTLLRTDGEVIECGPHLRREWFCATVGGVGLTGLILTAEIQLQRVSGPWLNAETIPYQSLDEFFELADGSSSEWEHTVSWFDCVSGAGRGLFIRGNYVDVSSGPEPSGRSISVPVLPPVSVVNALTLRAFNSGYFNIGRLRAGCSVVHYESFFYPLDSILKWNRIYGPKGFFQYQCVVPRLAAKEAIADILKAIAKSGLGSFLAVLKTFGNRESQGMLSFPCHGVTLALDFPNKGKNTELLFNRLDAIVGEAGGRLYLAKDARMTRSFFEATYPRFQEFLTYRDPGVSSAMSRRLMGY